MRHRGHALHGVICPLLVIYGRSEHQLRIFGYFPRSQRSIRTDRRASLSLVRVDPVQLALMSKQRIHVRHIVHGPDFYRSIFRTRKHLPCTVPKRQTSHRASMAGERRDELFHPSIKHVNSFIVTTYRDDILLARTCYG